MADKYCNKWGLMPPRCDTERKEREKNDRQKTRISRRGNQGHS